MFLVFRFLFLLPAAGDEPCLVCCLLETSVVLLKDLDPVAFRDVSSPEMLALSLAPVKRPRTLPVNQDKGEEPLERRHTRVH